jgi:phosphoglycerate kinase
MHTLASIGDIKGKRVFLRLDLNMPLINGVVANDFRLRMSLPTVLFLIEKGAQVIVASHLGDKEASMAPVFDCLKKYIQTARFSNLPIGSGELLELTQTLTSGEVLLLENLRRDDGEEKNDPLFVQKLSGLADIYVNDAFSACHRAHASIVGLPKLLPSFAGLLLEKEVFELGRAFNPEKPFFFILGGAKFETKIPLLEKFLPISDTLFIGGALANDILKAKGFEIGTSRVDGTVDAHLFAESDKVITPLDVVTETGGVRKTKKREEVAKEECILDAGPATIELISQKLQGIKTILWNGPLGAYERGFTEGTESLAKKIAESGVHSIVGGGDTVAAIEKLGLFEKFGFVSTGGGAMLDFLTAGTLPGVEVLK